MLSLSALEIKRVVTITIIIIIIVVVTGRYAVSAVGLLFILSVCEQDYCKSNELISLKLDVMIGPTSRKNRLTLGGNPVPDTDTRLLFHFSHHCGTGDFRRLLAFVTLTVTGRFP